MKPVEIFEHAINRALFINDLHDLVVNTKKPVKDSLAKRYKEIAGWKDTDTLLRVGNPNCILLVRNHPTIAAASSFSTDSLADLLRGALTGGVSALDRFMHDLVVFHCLPLLAGSSDKTPKKLAAFPIPLADAEASLKHALRRSGGATASRPRTTLKERFRTALHDKTFQSSSGIEEAATLLGISGCWGLIASEMGDSAEPIKKRLNGIVRRRNQIVHEGDMARSARPQSVKLHGIASATVRADLDWLRTLGQAINVVVEDKL